MNAPKNNASDDRNNQIASFGLLTPVLVAAVWSTPISARTARSSSPNSP
jgi:hypothetical protein